MKVLHVIPSASPVRGGPTQGCVEIVSALRLLGVDAEIACTNDDGPGVLDVPMGELVSHLGAPTRFFPKWMPKTSALREFTFSASFTSWLWKHIEDYDLIHVHAMFSYTSTVAMWMARNRGVPYINRPLGLLCTWSLQQSAARKRWYLALMEKANLNGSAGLEYTAEQERDEASPLKLTAPPFVLPFGLHVPSIIPNARRILRENFGLPADKPVVLFLSRLHPKKGLDILMDALATMTDTDFALVVAGSGEAAYEAELRERAANGPLNGRVIFAGFAKGDFKQVLLQGSDVFGLTSHSESFAIAALEAMSVGLPVVLTPGVPLASLVENHQLGYSVPLDHLEIATALKKALNKPPTEAQRQNARSLVENNFAWEVIGKRCHEVYEAVLQHETLPSFELSKVA